MRSTLEIRRGPRRGLVFRSQRQLGGRLAVLIPAMMATSLAVAQSPYELRPGVLIDPVEERVFLMGPEGIDAILLDLGTLAWHSEEAAMPLAFRKGNLVALADNQAFGELRLVVLDAKNGTVLEKVTVELPQAVLARPNDSLSSSFRIWADRGRADRDTVQLSWRFEHRVAQGLLPTGLTPPPRVESGSVLVHPPTGSAARLLGRPEEPRRDVLAGESERLPGVPGRQFVSAEGIHILTSHRENNDSVWNKYRWTLYTRRGERLGSLATHTSYASFSVIDSLLVYETRSFKRRLGGETVAFGPMVRAVALESGIEQWARRLRETAYRGPYPP